MTHVKFVFVTIALLASLIGVASLTTASSIWYVAPGGNDSNNCQSPVSLCATINGALSQPGFVAGDTVLVATGVYTGSGLDVVLLDKSATISGGWEEAFTLHNGLSVIDGENVRRGIRVSSGVNAVIERLQVQHGYAYLNNGGGIYNEGHLTLNSANIFSNTAATGGGLYSYDGVLMINNSSVVDNLSAGNSGGGIFNTGALLTLNNSTVSYNRTLNFGGGIYNQPAYLPGTTKPAVLNINSSTIADNSAYEGGGGIVNEPDASGVATVTVQNTIVAGNTSAAISRDCIGPIRSSGYNLIGDASGCAFSASVGDKANSDAKLGRQEGSPGYLPLLPDSPAINAGNPSGCADQLGNPLDADQRGFPRFSRCDIGAYEMQPIGFSTKLADRSIVKPGDQVSYTIALANGSTTSLGQVRVRDTLPISLTYIDHSLTAPGGSYGYDAGVITWTGTLTANESVTIAFAAIIDQGLGSIVNSAVISGAQEIITRTATVKVGSPPASPNTYLPMIARNFCAGPLYADDFSNPASGWPVTDNGHVRREYLDGEYRILIKNTNYWAGSRLEVKFSDFAASVDVRNVSGTDATYGIIFGLSDDWNQFYTFEVYPDGYYSIYRYDSGVWTTLAKNFSAAINQGTASNHVTVVRSSVQIAVYANGQFLTSMADGSYVGAGHPGVIVTSYQPNTDVRFDNFKIYPVGCQLDAAVATVQPAVGIQSSILDRWANAADGERKQGR